MGSALASRPSSPVWDPTHALSTPLLSALSQALEEHRSATGEDVVLAIEPATEPGEISVRARELASTWEIGQTDRQDMGIFILVQPNRGLAWIAASDAFSSTLGEEKIWELVSETFDPIFGSHPQAAIAGLVAGTLEGIQSPLIESGRLEALLQDADLGMQLQPPSGIAKIWHLFLVLGLTTLVLVIIGLLFPEIHLTSDGRSRFNPITLGLLSIWRTRKSSRIALGGWHGAW